MLWVHLKGRQIIKPHRTGPKFEGTPLEELLSLGLALERPHLHQLVLEVQALEGEADDAARRRVQVAVQLQLLLPVVVNLRVAPHEVDSALEVFGRAALFCAHLGPVKRSLEISLNAPERLYCN